MTLEEMQAALDSEARKKAAKLEKENKHLTVAIRKKQERIDRLEDNLRAMFNRCFATTAMRAPEMCFFCGLRRECDRLRSVGKEVSNGTADKQSMAKP